MKAQVIPVLLAGGTGTRLWPVSRKSYPKQFCKLFDDLSLLQKTAERARYISGISNLIVVTHENYYFLCRDQLEAIGFTNVHYILESYPKNTAPALSLAAQYVHKYIDIGPNTTLLVLPSDHYLSNYISFKGTVEKALYLSEQNYLVIFGVEPHSAKTGYGYIKKGEPCITGFRVSRFIEKPSFQTAKNFLLQGEFYWNSGMFLFKARTYLAELENLANDIFIETKKAFQATKKQSEFFRVSKNFNSCREGSIDYEVMERTTKAVMLPLRTEWNDFGCWSSVGETGKPDAQGNVQYGNVMINKCQNCLVTSEGRRVVAIGVKDQVIVSTPDAILVIDKNHAQEVKGAVEEMKLQQDSVATEHRRIYRPWGFYEKLASGPGYQVKYLVVNPRAALSLQLHHHRSEHWLIMSGEAEVVNGENHFRLFPNKSTYIEKETKHRLSNPGNQPLLMIEVQSGEYLGEDDIVRFEDVYGRLDKLINS